ncbi:MAG: M48 family metalloprotease [Planctomycetes bacterium]|nr:M48 family metalloprotease [Planctomycetota bacterium]
MALPIVLLLGFLVLFGSLTLDPPLPGSGSVTSVLWTASLWPLPSLLAIVALRRLRRRLCFGETSGLHPRVWLRMSVLATPAVVYLVAGPGGWHDMTWQWAAESHLASIGLMALPLVAIEVPRMLLAAVAQVWLDGDSVPGAPFRQLPGFLDLWPILRLRLAWPLLMVMPCVVLGTALDLLKLAPVWHEFFVNTSVGATLGMLGMLVLFGLLVPFWFRISFGVKSNLPEPVGSLLRKTAAALGFSPSRVYLLPTGGRAMNAMMVGPLPIGRMLCVTDGLLGAIDEESLAGVVAHEVGHARMGHPGLLLTLTGVVPVLLLSPATALDPLSADPLWQALFTLLGVVAVWSIVRALAHRFEHEADIASVRALGAGPCSRALLTVSGAAIPIRHSWLGRVSSLHPEERLRCMTMLRYELEPEFRKQFDATGRRLRVAILIGLLISVVLAGITWALDWRFERVIWRLNSGDVAGAVQLDLEIGTDIPARWTKTWKLVREDLGAVAAITPSATSWEEAAPQLATEAWQRGVEVILAKGSAAARPWFALAAEGGKRAPDRIMRRLLYEFCRAADQSNTERMDEVRRLVRRLGVPKGLEPVFAQ